LRWLPAASENSFEARRIGSGEAKIDAGEAGPFLGRARIYIE
jgi:hypothetical protein